MSSARSLLTSLHPIKLGSHSRKVGKGRRELPLGPGGVSATFVMGMALCVIHCARPVTGTTV